MLVSEENKIAVPEGSTRQEDSNESAAITQITTDPEFLVIEECLNETDDPEVVKELMRQLMAKQKTKHYLQGDEAHRMLSFMNDRITAMESRTERIETMLKNLIGNVNDRSRLQ